MQKIIMKENSYKKKWLKILTIYRNNVYLIQLNDNLYDSCETAGDSSLPNNILIPLNELIYCFIAQLLI